MKPFNLAFVVPYVPPAYIGGGETYIYYLSKELARLGVNVSLFTTKVPRPLGEWSWEHVNLYECQSLFKVGNTPIIPSLFQKLLRNNRFELIHTVVPSGFACDVSALISGVYRIPLIVTYHCDLVQQTIISKFYAQLLKFFSLKNAHRIISTTLSYAKTSPLLRDFLDKVRIVPMGTHLAGYSLSQHYREEVRRKYEINEAEKVVLFVGGLGRFHRFKRVDLLIKAMAEVCIERKDVTLIVVGKGSLMQNFQTLSQQLGLRKVIFAGYVSNEELPKYYSGADLFVLPSLTREEAFGIVLVEAASCGVVPLCFDIPGPSEVCKNLEGFTVPISVSEKPEVQLSKAILGALAKDLKSRSEICRKRAEEYAWSKVAQKTLEVYQELL